MRQDDYEIILSCIRFGAPALADKLIISFNNTVEAENRLHSIKRTEEQAIKKAELDAKAVKEAKLKARREARKESIGKSEQLQMPI